MPPDRSPREQAEAAEIVDQGATITAAEPMDHNRTGEVDAAVAALRDRIADHAAIAGLGTVSEEPRAWRAVADDLADRGPADLADRLDALVGRVEQPYPSLVRLRFRLEEGLDFVPGQYVRISYAGEEPRVYSIASPPSDEELELCIRRVPGGELTPDLCDRASVGDELFVRGPFGDEFTLQAPSDRDLVFVATGTGVAPFKSMVDHLFETGLDEFEGGPRQVWLFLGSGWADHLPYREAFRELAETRDNFHFVPTLSRESFLTNWAGETDYVQRTLLKYLDSDAVDALPDPYAESAAAEPAVDVDARIDPGRTEAYVCGLGAMADGVVEVLEALDLPEGLVRVESYG
ncbi:FAD-binding oxidoreductase [Haloglomus litoreum]|uniref:FAD-binding oxidoreductase n=1 Tax=Haloglomus litoreum TaxID=3034026 RepID=UPI0023E7B173|nr:FAD-binding oxidoreductase [Haloglomus sp. DT116]